jgi:16S rRNA (uracil1498-N3)-methyltransferase
VNPRFFAPEALASGDLVTLPEEEAQHLTRVLRLGAGAAVCVFNGIGDEFE